MTRSNLPAATDPEGYEATGFSHLAFSIDNTGDLDKLFLRLENDGVRIISKPHMTGDGYYEACILDPDGNRIEIIVVM